jgi:hypothetical protein
MILCQTCLREYPDETTQCATCGQPLALMRPSPAATGRPFPDPRPEPVATVYAPRVAITAGEAVAAPEVISAAEAAIAAPVEIWSSSTDPLPRSSAPTAVAHFRLRLNNGQVFGLTGKAFYLIGRADPANGIAPDIDLARFGGVEGGVSRAHAVIHARQEGYFVEDLGSMNETLLNFHRLLPRQLYGLKDGDQLRFGQTAALVVIG